MIKYLLPHGKQSVKSLAKHGQGMTNIEIIDKNIKCFEKYAKKYGVDFALKKDIIETPPKYLVFFKAKDNDAIMSAFKDFTDLLFGIIIGVAIRLVVYVKGKNAKKFRHGREYGSARFSIRRINFQFQNLLVEFNYSINNCKKSDLER